MTTKDWISIVTFRLLELTFVAAFFTLLIFICSKSIPTENERLADILFGGLLSVVLGIANYEWGSSRGSDKKTEIMATTASTAATEASKVVSTVQEDKPTV